MTLLKTACRPTVGLSVSAQPGGSVVKYVLQIQSFLIIHSASKPMSVTIIVNQLNVCGKCGGGESQGDPSNLVVLLICVLLEVNI